MKVLLYRIGAAFAATIFLFSSCSGTKTKAEAFQCENVEVSEEIPLTQGRDDMFNFDVRIEYPSSAASEQVLTKIRENILAATLGTDYSSYSSVEDAVNKYKEDRIADYKEENTALLGDLLELDPDEEATEADLSWDEKIEGRFQGDYKGIRSYIIDSYIYSGGAHGNSGQTAVNIKMSTGEVIDEEDFFMSDYSTKLGDIISSHLREALPDEESYDMLFMTDVEPNGNFQVTQTGINYIFSPYEIGPYALGTITVAIPWEEVTDLIDESIF